MNSRARKDADTPRACTVCGAKLSTYNRNDTCWAHTVELPWQGPNTKPR